MTKASCPNCGKVVEVAEASSAIAGRLLRHHQPGAGKMCPLGGKHRALKRELIHPCARCAELPERPDFLRDGTIADQYRPPTPRPVTGGTLKLCATHRREHTAARKTRARDQYRAKSYGLTPERWRELVAAQGGACACGLTHSKSRGTNGSQAKDAAVLAVDHSHERQAECVAAGRHGPETACEHCVRGALGRRCNREIIGRFTSDQLRRLADYMDNPTAQRLGWWDDPTDDDTDDTDDDTEN